MKENWKSRVDLPVPFMQEWEIESILGSLALFPGPVRALEWGSGKSTAFFPEFLHEGSSWESVEHDAGWGKSVSAFLDGRSRRDIRLRIVPNNAPFQDGVDDGDYHSFKDYVDFPAGPGKKFDVILVDGRARVACMGAGWRLLGDDGIMILHDAQRREYDPGIPGDAFLLRITDPHMDSGGKISILFMSRSLAGIRALESSLRLALPASLRFDGPDAAAGVGAPCAAPGREAGSEAGAGTLNCLFVNSYYAGFLQEHYRSHPGLESSPYDEQLRSLRSACFGDSDFYSRNLEAAGWRADDIIVNCAPLQARWSREHGFDGDGLSVCVEQVRAARPDVVYVQDMNLVPRGILERIRPHCGLVAGQIATPIVNDIPFDLYDVLFTSFPHYAERFRAAGRTAYYQPLAFESELVDRFAGARRDCGCSFVGGFSGLHVASYKMMEQLARSTPIEFWGYGAESLPSDSAIQRRHHGEAWGLDMFGLFFGSLITVNRHGEVAENYANNMRMFEATGCGALLVTDYKDNLDELFRVGEEVVAYRSPEECADLVNYYLANPVEAGRIARAGQARTLRDHTYAKRMAQTAEILDRHLRYRREAGCYQAPDAGRISWGHTPIGVDDVTDALTDAWKDAAIPSRQRALVQAELAQLYRGNVAGSFRALADLLSPRLSSGDSLLEIGCASGYYYEILEYLTNRRIDYTGADYSPALIGMARDYYPNAAFVVADGARLPFPDRSFRFAISSGVLLHVTDYRDHIAENCRVASDYAVAHRTPVCRSGPTRYLKKFAYGVETVEIELEEREILEAYAAHGFREIGRVEFASDPAKDLFQVSYLFERVRA